MEREPESLRAAAQAALSQIAGALALKYDDSADPDAGIAVTYDQFLEAYDRMREVDFPIEREPDAAWPHFVGWRINYEQAAYGIAAAVDAVPALWSGPRRRPVEPIPPLRPKPGAPSS